MPYQITVGPEVHMVSANNWFNNKHVFFLDEQGAPPGLDSTETKPNVTVNT
jgi:hypothetical protein